MSVNPLWQSGNVSTTDGGGPRIEDVTPIFDDARKVALGLSEVEDTSLAALDDSDVLSVEDESKDEEKKDENKKEASDASKDEEKEDEDAKDEERKEASAPKPRAPRKKPEPSLLEAAKDE